MILQEDYNLNLESQLSKKYVKVSQYDTGRRLLITLIKNDGSMFKIPSEASASINGLKPDGNGFRYDCSIENNKVVVDMKEQMTVLAGSVKCEILLSKGGERIATANFMLSVEESPLSENTPISSTDIPLLRKAIEASKIVLSVEKTVKGYSESASKSAQNSQASAESALNASNASAESANSASQSATNASAKATEAKKSETNAKQSETNASNSAKEAKASAESAIQTKAEIEQLKKETVEQTKALTDSAKQEISTVKDATVAEVTELKNSTVSEITTLKDSTVEAVTSLKDNAKAEADRATESSASAKVQAEKAQASADSIANVTSDVEKLKEDLPNKITKFYASNQGETHITDSDNGKIQDMMIYGKSSQDGTPSIENPVEIKSVVNPTIKLLGSNILKIADGEYQDGEATVTVSNGVVKSKGTANRYLDILLTANNQFVFKEGTKIIFSSNNVKGIENINNPYLDFSNNNTIGFSIANNNLNTPYIIKENDTKYHFSLFIRGHAGKTYNETWKPQVLIGETITPFKPYTEQTITLPITLNAIPVSSGGNVTINGQQYMSDYIDVELGKIVRRVGSIILTGEENWELGFENWETYPHCFRAENIKKNVYKGNVMSEKYMWYEKYANIDLNSMNAPYDSCIAISDSRFSTVEEFTNELKTQNSNGKQLIAYYIMTTPQEEDLSLEEIELLKSLSTYYPVTNITVGSEQLDGYTVFNYPISLANGWNYVKQQLNDNRDYIYDMDLQSAEAYVNSEYAVTLTELEV